MSDTSTKSNPALHRRGMLGAGALGSLAAGAAGLLLPGSAQAQTVDAGKSKLHQVLDRGHVIVGTGSTNPPWHFEDETGKLVGMDIDMARLIAKGLFDDPEKVEFVLQGSDARIPSLITDKVDIVVQWMTVTPGRAQQVEFTIPYYREGVSLMVMADGAKYKTYDELKAAGSSVSVGGMQNVFLEDWIHMALPEAKVEAFESPDATLQALNAHRIDAYQGDQSNIRWLMQSTPDRYVDTGHGWMPNSYASAVKPGDQIWLNFINTVYKEALMGVDFPILQASYKKWFGIDVPMPKIGFPQEFA